MLLQHLCGQPSHGQIVPVQLGDGVVSIANWRAGDQSSSLWLGFSFQLSVFWELVCEIPFVKVAQDNN